jgi:general secretion pathway protein J
MSRSRLDGFSLLEAIATVALTATILLALSSITGIWLPNWRRGFADLQQADLVGEGLERLLEDLSVAEYVTPWGDAPGPLFEGDPASVVFVRSAIGPNARPELEVVRIAAGSDDRGPALMRTRAPFAPGAQGGPAQPLAFGDPVALVRAPYRITFAFAGAVQVWAQRWRKEERLPEAVRVTLVDASGKRQPTSTVVRLKNTARGVPRRDARAAAPDAPPASTDQPGPSASQGKP